VSEVGGDFGGVIFVRLAKEVGGGIQDDESGLFFFDGGFEFL